MADKLTETDEDVEKASLRGLRMSSAQRRLVATGKVRRGDIGRSREGRTFVRVGGARSNSVASTREVPLMIFNRRGKLARTPNAEQRRIKRRLGIRKSLDDLGGVIEKARMVTFRGRKMPRVTRRYIAGGDLFNAPASRVSAKTSSAVGRKLKRMGVGQNAAAARRAASARGKRFRRLFG